MVHRAAELPRLREREEGRERESNDGADDAARSRAIVIILRNVDEYPRPDL